MGRLLPLILALAAVSCSGQAAPLDQTIRVDDVVTGWFGAEPTEDGKNKIVPSISLRLTNTGAAPIGAVQLNLIFRRVGDPEEWSTALVRAVDRQTGLAPGASSAPIVVRAPQGYTGLQPNRQLLENRLFVDAKVEIFGKHGSAPPVKIGEYRIDRQLLAH
jgi:hypothetical protein